jgi:hypothetical protein
VYVPLSELGLSQPLSRQRECHPPPRPGGRGILSGERGVGESHFRRLEDKLSTLPTLCPAQDNNNKGNEPHQQLNKYSVQIEGERDIKYPVNGTTKLKEMGHKHLRPNAKKNLVYGTRCQS